MRNGRLALGLSILLLGGALAGPASAAKRPIVGIGDQKVAMFDDPRMEWLGIKHARLVVPWYVANGGKHLAERDYVDAWMASARRTGVEPLVGFGHGFEGRMRTYLPSVKQFRRAAQRFQRRYPWVKVYIPWNEANHCSQPTCKRPARVARYYDALKGVCRRCTVLAPAVLDQPNMVAYLKRFRKVARHEPRIYAMHNYLDVNRLRSTGTRRLLRALPRKARLWVAETGGLVERQHFRGKADFPESPTRAGVVVRFSLELARKHKKIDRVYLYHWNIHRIKPNWDSGLIDLFGIARPGFTSLARFLGLDPARAPVVLPPPPQPGPEPPIAENPPPSEPAPSGDGSTSGSADSSSQPQQQPQPQPAEEPECSLMDLCIDPLGGF